MPRRCSLVSTLLPIALVAAVPAQAARVQWTVADGGNGHWYEAILVAGPGIGWTAARDAATAVGGYLATAAAASENQFIYDLVKGVAALWVPDSGNNHIGPWLGGYQPTGSAEPDGGWSWVTGESWAFTNWATGEPNNYDSAEHYLHYYWRNDGSSLVQGPWWNDLRETIPLGVRGYVVERETVAPIPGTLALLGLGLLGFPRRRR